MNPFIRVPEALLEVLSDGLFPDLEVNESHRPLAVETGDRQWYNYWYAANHEEINLGQTEAVASRSFGTTPRTGDCD